jgi:hypothetical protein
MIMAVMFRPTIGSIFKKTLVQDRIGSRGKGAEQAVLTSLARLDEYLLRDIGVQRFDLLYASQPRLQSRL